MRNLLRKTTMVVGLCLASVLSTDASAEIKADFALLATTDSSVQCGAIKGSANNPKPTAFTIFITMTNSGDAGAVRVEYEDGDSVAYQIPAGRTLNISLAAGGRPGLDQLITVREVGAANLSGQISILIQELSKPHPSVAPDFCTTSP